MCALPSLEIDAVYIAFFRITLNPNRRALVAIKPFRYDFSSAVSNPLEAWKFLHGYAGRVISKRPNRGQIFFRVANKFRRLITVIKPRSCLRWFWAAQSFAAYSCPNRSLILGQTGQKDPYDFA